MSRIDRAIREYESLEAMAHKDQWMNRLHPLVKFVVTVLFIALTVSVGKYNLAGLLLMAVYPLVMFITGELSVKEALRRLKIALPLILAVGIFNPLFDRETVLVAGGIGVSGGVLSMLTLLLKGLLTVLAAYLLVVSTPIEGICHALRLLHVPGILVTEVLLMNRYILLLLREVKHVSEAYELRAPGQKGIAPKAWGSLTGQILLRTIDRAREVGESMRLRGFSGEFQHGTPQKIRRTDFFYLAAWTSVLLLLRFVPLGDLIGRAVTGSLMIPLFPAG